MGHNGIEQQMGRQRASSARKTQQSREKRTRGHRQRKSEKKRADTVTSGRQGGSRVRQMIISRQMTHRQNNTSWRGKQVTK